jgi:hypothetical protein
MFRVDILLVTETSSFPHEDVILVRMTSVRITEEKGGVVSTSFNMNNSETKPASFR